MRAAALRHANWLLVDFVWQIASRCDIEDFRRGSVGSCLEARPEIAFNSRDWGKSVIDGFHRSRTLTIVCVRSLQRASA